MTRARGVSCYMHGVQSPCSPCRFGSLALFAVATLCLDARILHAQAATTDAGQALRAVRDADPLEIARVVQRFGDASILRLLADAEPLATRIAAMRATPWLAEPEDALASLASCIASRDPELAEAAARALFAIAHALDAGALERREHAVRALAAVVAGLHALSAQTWIRADLRALAASAAAQLEAIGAPAPARD